MHTYNTTQNPSKRTYNIVRHHLKGKLLLVCMLSLSILAGCGLGSAKPGSSRLSQTTPITPTATLIDPSCQDFVASQNTPALDLPISLPPHTIIGSAFALHGEGQTWLCTESASQTAIDTYMNTSLAAEGWRPYDPARDGHNECNTGTLKWVKGNSAVNWTFDSTQDNTTIGPPRWILLTCGDLNQP